MIMKGLSAVEPPFMVEENLFSGGAGIWDCYFSKPALNVLSSQDF